MGLSGTDQQKSVAALTLLRHNAVADKAAASDIDLAVSADLIAQPAALRNPALAVRLAETGAALTHGRAPGFLLLLASAYRANGQIAQATQVAQDGLTLLPAQRPGRPRCRLRKLLENLATQPGTVTASPKHSGTS